MVRQHQHQPTIKMPFFGNAVISDGKLPGNKEKKRSKKYKKIAPVSVNCADLAVRFGVEKSDVEKTYELFLRLDDDCSGSITAPEIAQGLSMFGQDVSPKTVQAVMRASDKNGDGEINFDEFLAVVISKMKLRRNKNDMHSVFEKFDKNGDGKLNADELMNIWQASFGTKISINEARAIIAQADAGNKGFVTYEEFIKMWQNI